MQHPIRQYLIRISVLGLALLALSACSSEPGETQSRQEHVWKDQVEAIDKAREVETILKRKHDQDQDQAN